MRGRWQATNARALERTNTLAHRGRYAAIGNAAYHTVGDRAQVVHDMMLAFDQLYLELGNAIGVLPYEGSAERVKAHPHWFVWWQSIAAPTFAAWADFRRAQLGDFTVASDYIAYGERFATDWPVYEDWHHRLELLREGAQKLGIQLESPPPSPLPTTAVENAAELAKDLGKGAKNAAGDVFTLTKVAVYGGLALGGLIALTALTSHARAGTDPIESWARLRR